MGHSVLGHTLLEFTFGLWLNYMPVSDSPMNGELTCLTAARTAVLQLKVFRRRHFSPVPGNLYRPYSPLRNPLKRSQTCLAP